MDSVNWLGSVRVKELAMGMRKEKHGCDECNN
jgi:hypothetical protein